MIEHVAVEPGHDLEHYASYAHLAMVVQELRAEAATVMPSLSGRTLWMVSSTAQGGGVAEMLPRVVALLRELGADVKWVVVKPRDPAFFALTKRLHNLIHGAGDPALGADDRALYNAESETLAAALSPELSAHDIVVVHDPQPAGVGALLEKRQPGLVTIWRCHIGLDDSTPETKAAWSFLEPYVSTYDHSVFSAPEYIPAYLTTKSTVIAPAIDPLTDKNRPLSVHRLHGVLCNAGLMQTSASVLMPDYGARAERLKPDGTFAPLTGDLELVYRPVVAQISRWDRLKGFMPLLEGFARLKRQYRTMKSLDRIERRRLELVRLVLAGPDPGSIADDPEAREVLSELTAAYQRLEPAIQRDVALLSLPMASRRENALMVNALQRCSSVVVQNSLREGFGLTATEAMWKPTAVMASGACGLRQQIRDRLDGRINLHPEEPRAVAELLIDMLGDPAGRDTWARRGQRRVHDEFLVFAQLRRWLRLLAGAQGGTVTSPTERGGF